MKVGTFEDVLYCAEHGVYDLTENGKCTGCGNCCSNFIPVTKSEIAKIKEYIKKHDIKRVEHRLLVCTEPSIDGMCPFLDDSKKLKCTIYPVRPSVCKIFLCSNSAKRDIRLNDIGRKDIDMRETFFGGEL